MEFAVKALKVSGCWLKICHQPYDCSMYTLQCSVVLLHCCNNGGQHNSRSSSTAAGSAQLAGAAAAVWCWLKHNT
jgi:hypothetical protein